MNNFYQKYNKQNYNQPIQPRKRLTEEEKNKITIKNLQGESGIVNVVRYFLNNGSEYLIYSLNFLDYLIVLLIKKDKMSFQIHYYFWCLNSKYHLTLKKILKIYYGYIKLEFY